MATPTSRRCPSPQNPFGAAKPREAVLAQRTGVKEEDILKADAAKDGAPSYSTGPSKPGWGSS